MGAGLLGCDRHLDREATHNDGLLAVVSITDTPWPFGNDAVLPLANVVMGMQHEIAANNQRSGLSEPDRDRTSSLAAYRRNSLSDTSYSSTARGGVRLACERRESALQRAGWR